MDDVVIINRRGAPIFLGNKFKFVPGRNRFSAEVFEVMDKMKGFHLMVNAKALQILDLKKKEKVVSADEVPVAALNVVPDAEPLDEPDVPMPKKSRAKAKKPAPVDAEVSIDEA